MLVVAAHLLSFTQFHLRSSCGVWQAVHAGEAGRGTFAVRDRLPGRNPCRCSNALLAQPLTCSKLTPHLLPPVTP